LALKEKSLKAAEQDATKRAAWWAEIATVQPKDLVFVDECGSHIALTRLYARAKGGARAVGVLPRNHGTPTTLVVALGPTGLGAVLSFPGALDRAAFRVYVRDLLGPTLRPGQTVVVDNLTVHKDPRIAELLGERGCALRFLPPYSPDFTPVELAIGKLKTTLRRLAPRAQDALDRAITTAVDEITPQDARHWFKHCGYSLPASPT
jgi:transposase